MKNNIYGNVPCFLNSKNLNQTNTLDTDVIVYGAPFEGESTWGDYTGVELGRNKFVFAQLAIVNIYLSSITLISVNT